MKLQNYSKEQKKFLIEFENQLIPGYGIAESNCQVVIYPPSGPVTWDEVQIYCLSETGKKVHRTTPLHDIEYREWAAKIGPVHRLC